jgi:hypothetical protein
LRGKVAYLGGIPPNARWNFRPGYSEMPLRLAPPVDARFDLRSSAIDFEFSTAASPGGKRVRATVGQGSAQVTAVSLGRITVGPL